ncbi:alpha/beta fold hydrolase [Oscillochloris sp. ZM17-4]|uniref:alpha/beta fold hydrolase n=1 Tax=Oscillochloris sp. ZM17-4 TaxID=2866714 RepID=UPI001C7302E0|nr:alpha/beta fold hydrolase [Oscillochloris sp. ZM17-4]MBX0326488.1 alpha/beta fold hydrolase [Oscillochloris sp. ZM17-4]
MQSRYITVHGYRLHYLEAGHGPAVLLLHGFGGSAEGWRATGDVLAGAGYRALAFDCLGFGRSQKPRDAPYSLEFITGLYVEAMGQLGIDRAAIVAHSMGGKYALATALLHPAMVTGLALVATDGFAPAAAMSKVGKWPLLCWSILWLSGQPPLVRAMMGAAFHQPEAFVTEEIIAQSSGAFQGWENIHALTALSQRYDATDLEISGMRARLGELRVPTLLTWGENDQIFPVAQSAVAAAEIPGARLITFPTCGHFPQIESARPFRGLLLGFLAGLRD